MPPSWWISFGASNPGQRRKEIRALVDEAGGTLEGFWARSDGARLYGVVSDLELDEELKRKLNVQGDPIKVDPQPLRKVRREDEPG